MADELKDAGFLESQAVPNPGLDRLKEALDFDQPGMGDDEAEPVESEPEDPSIAPEHEADYTALLERGFTIDEARGAVKSGLAKRIISSLPKQAEPSGDAQESDAGQREPETDPSEIAALKAQIRALEERVGRSPDATDDIILKEGLADIFGSDRWVQPDSDHATNRKRVRDTVEVLKAGFKAQGKQLPSAADLVRRAVRAEFGDEIVEMARRPIEKRKQQFTQRPTARPTREDVPGEALARRNFSERLRKLGG